MMKRTTPEDDTTSAVKAKKIKTESDENEQAAIADVDDESGTAVDILLYYQYYRLLGFWLIELQFTSQEFSCARPFLIYQNVVHCY